MRHRFPNWSWSILILLLLISTGCKKEEDKIIIEGIVNDPAQSIPVEGADVFLYGKVFEGGMFNPDPSVIAYAVTGTDGKFLININQVKASDFEIRVEKPHYFPFMEVLDNNEIAAGKTYKPAYTLNPEGWLKLRVQNINPYSSADLIAYKIESDNPSCSSCCNSNYVQGQGTLYDATSTCRSKGGKEVLIIYNVHKAGNSKIDSATVLLPVFDTAYYHLQY
ncbi:MAG: carboxypeptidase-like regulatory domain-containing protein [Bacteroidales bacterium]